MEDIYEGSISMGLGGDQYDDAANWANYTKKKNVLFAPMILLTQKKRLLNNDIIM